MIATDMAKSGRFSVDGIAEAIAKYSPNVESRKAGHVEDYARRTAEQAWNAPEVAAERERHVEQARQAKRERGGPSHSIG